MTENTMRFKMVLLKLRKSKLSLSVPDWLSISFVQDLQHRSARHDDGGGYAERVRKAEAHHRGRQGSVDPVSKRHSRRRARYASLLFQPNANHQACFSANSSPPTAALFSFFARFFCEDHKKTKRHWNASSFCFQSLRWSMTFQCWKVMTSRPSPLWHHCTARNWRSTRWWNTRCRTLSTKQKVRKKSKEKKTFFNRSQVHKHFGTGVKFFLLFPRFLPPTSIFFLRARWACCWREMCRPHHIFSNFSWLGTFQKFPYTIELNLAFINVSVVG